MKLLDIFAQRRRCWFCNAPCPEARRYVYDVLVKRHGREAVERHWAEIEAVLDREQAEKQLARRIKCHLTIGGS